MSTKAHDVTSKLVEWITSVKFKNIPTEAVKLAKHGIRDGIGVALAGKPEDAGRIITDYIRSLGQKQEAIVIGSGFRSSAEGAALANGVMAHALDFDDTNHPGLCHPSCHLMPTVLALGEARKASGADILTAYLVGLDVEVKLGRGLNPPSYQWGWHGTAMLGTIGAAAAAAKLLGLDMHKTKMALAIACSEAGGVRQNFGTMGKPFHAGNAARSGVVAAQLAEVGFTGAEDALEGQYGYCHVFSGQQEPKWEEITKGLNKVWEITLPYGIAIKPYPACGATHPAIEAALSLATEFDIKPKEVSRVTVGINDRAPGVLVYNSPRTGLEGKFSMQYCIAAALLDRTVGLEQFTDAKVNASEARRLMGKVSMYPHPDMADNTEWGAVVTIEMSNGNKHEKRVELAKGKVIRPMSRDELLGKFRMCARISLDESKIEPVLKELERLEELEDISELCELLKG